MFRWKFLNTLEYFYDFFQLKYSLKLNNDGKSQLYHFNPSFPAPFNIDEVIEVMFH